MDALSLPRLSLPVAKLAGQPVDSTPRPPADDGIIAGKTIIVTSTSNYVTININNEGAKNYDVVPNVPTKIVIDIDKVTSLNQMFAYEYQSIAVQALDFTYFDTSKVTSFAYAFLRYVKMMTSLNMSNSDTSSATTMFGMFQECISLPELDLSSFDTSNVRNMSYMFVNCTSLKSLNISSFNMVGVTSVVEMFANCNALTDLEFGNNLKVSIDFADCPLSHDSALSVINGLAEVTTAKTVTFKSTTYATLSDEEIAIATSKGWSVVSA